MTFIAKESSAALGLNRSSAGAITRFNPKQTRMKLGALKEGVKLAAKIKDWEALEAAIAAVIAEQQAFVAWWDGNVTPGRNAKLLQGAKLVNAERHERDLSVKDATSQTGVTQPQVSRWRRRLADEPAYREQLRGDAYLAMWALRSDRSYPRAEAAFRGGDDEWRTPEKHLELARKVLGEIDLDPASSARAQEVVKARQFFDQKQNGLRQPWRGRVFLNPPYGRRLIGKFVAKLLTEVRAGRVTAAILLTHNYSDTRWFRKAADRADAICFTTGRVRFKDDDDGLARPTLGQTFHYFGDDRATFIDIFAPIGFVLVRP